MKNFNLHELSKQMRESGVRVVGFSPAGKITYCELADTHYESTPKARVRALTPEEQAVARDEDKKAKKRAQARHDALQFGASEGFPEWLDTEDLPEE
jgi:hypothetical protein